MPSINDYTVLYPQEGPFSTKLEGAAKSGFSAILTQGTYVVNEPIVISVSNFTLTASGVANILFTGNGSLSFTGSNIRLEGINFYEEFPTSGKSWVKFNTGSKQIKVYDCIFKCGTSDIYTSVSLASAAVMLDLEGVTGKDVQNNEFLPYKDVICIKLTSGFGANICNNRFYNGLKLHLEDLVGATYPNVRPCKMAVAMYDEEHGNIDHNQFWGLGMAQTAATAAVPMDAVIYFERLDSDHETGHMDISDNQIEMCYAPKLIWGRGLKFSKINNNNTGVGQVNSGNGPERPLADSSSAATAEGDASIALEGTYLDGSAFGLGLVPYNDIGGKSRPADYITIAGNNLHNPGTGDECAAIFLKFVDDVCIESNHITRLFNQYGIRIHDASKRVVIRNTSFNYDASNLATSQIPVEIRSYETITSPITVVRTCQDIVVGEVSCFNAASAELVVTRQLLGGLSFTDSSRNLTKTGAFANYTFTAGDTFTAVSGTTAGTLVTTPIAISSKTNNNTIVLAADMASGNNDVGPDVVGYITYTAHRDNVYKDGLALRGTGVSPAPNSASPIKFFATAGNTAGGSITVTGIAVEDTVIGILRLDRNGTASNINFLHVAASEATISAADTITISPTDTSGDALWIVYYDKSAGYTTNIRPSN